jgi:SAM-dependent methyltransferase
MPLANAFIDPEAQDQPERSYPLHAKVCDACFLVQLDVTVPPEEIFDDYAYLSSYADSWVAHARRYVDAISMRFGLGAGSQVIEIASNDGYLLQHFVARGIPVLGIEPARTAADRALARGIPTERVFFGQATARSLRVAGYRADLLVSNNVLAHVPDINDFVAGVPEILEPEGLWTIEFPHLLTLMQQGQFDTIYHEHYSYLSLLAIEPLLERHGLRVFDVEQIPTHGGSLRLFVCQQSAAYPQGAGVTAVRAVEASAWLQESSTYDDFGLRAKSVRKGLLAFLQDARSRHMSVVAYGAAAKGNTMLNSCQIGPELIAYAVDRNPLKQGRLLPGSRLPVEPPSRIFETRPDFVLILPWNLRDEIVGSMVGIRDWGGRFVVALPQLEVF